MLPGAAPRVGALHARISVAEHQTAAALSALCRVTRESAFADARSASLPPPAPTAGRRRGSASSTAAEEDDPASVSVATAPRSSTPQVVDVIVTERRAPSGPQGGEAAQLRGELRRAEQRAAEAEAELRVARREQLRLEDLARQLREELRERAEAHAAERERLLQEQLRAAQQAARAQALHADADAELSHSFAEREKLAERLAQLHQDASAHLDELHKAQEEAEQHLLRCERLQAERDSDQVELQALRASHDFHERYIRAVTQQRDRLHEHARRLHQQCREAALAPEPLPALPPAPAPEPPPASPPPYEHYQQGAESPPPGAWHADPAPAAAPHQTPPRPPARPCSPASCHAMLPPAAPEGPYTAPAAPEGPYAPPPVPWGPPPAWARSLSPVRDPLSPTRVRPLGEGVSPTATEPASPSEGVSPRHSAELSRLRERLERLAADMVSSRIEGAEVRQDYLTEAVARVSGAHDALEMLCGAIAQWAADIGAGRGAWGDAGDSGAEAEERRRRRSARRRSELKRAVSRTLERSGVGGETAAALEVHLGAARVRDAVSAAAEAFAQARAAADSRAEHTRRGLQQTRAELQQALERSVCTAQAQAESLRACAEDAEQREGQLLGLSEAKLRAEQESAGLRAQIAERQTYMEQVERLSERVREEADKEQSRVSTVVGEIEHRHRDELRRLQEEYESRLEGHQKGHREEVASWAAQLQQLREQEAAARQLLEDAARQRDQQRAKRKSEKAAREELERERAGLRVQLGAQGHQLKEARDRLRELDKENAVLRELTTKLRADVMRGQIIIESESERQQFAQWRRRQRRAAGSAAADGGASRGCPTAPPSQQPSPARRSAPSPYDDGRSSASTAPGGRAVRDAAARRDWVYGVRSPPRSLHQERLAPYRAP
eukprot:TRINITY_DN30013_c0_g3_i2.p1 TRINITY_DN30013_c0_g3~~TRINITY_DN30013_c0_g3_i2.p1  ORF type:complete len:902 (+),score=306.94 TRINITY_DN30013_c0_g3_i2:103-2808(+)